MFFSTYWTKNELGHIESYCWSIGSPKDSGDNHRQPKGRNVVRVLPSGFLGIMKRPGMGSKKKMGSPFPTNQFHGMTLQVLKAAHYLGMNQNLSYQMWMGWTSYCHTHRVTNQQFSRFHIGATPNKRRFASVRARVSASLWFWMSSVPCALPPRIREQLWWARLAARERWWEHLCRYQANL